MAMPEHPPEPSSDPSHDAGIVPVNDGTALGQFLPGTAPAGDPPRGRSLPQNAPATETPRPAAADASVIDRAPAPRFSRRRALGFAGAIAAFLVGVTIWSKATAPPSGVPARSTVATPPAPFRPSHSGPVASIAAPNVAAATANPPDAAATAHDQPPLSASRSLPNVVGRSATDGRLIVTTRPAGSRVTVDGIGWGVTPITVRYLPFGAKRIRVTKDGFRAEERIVRLDAVHSTVRLQIPLRTVAGRKRGPTATAGGPSNTRAFPRSRLGDRRSRR
jgi:hypothetical protein